MQSCIRRRDQVAAVAHYRHLEEALWRALELLPSEEICVLYEMAIQATHEMCELIERGEQTRAGIVRSDGCAHNTRIYIPDWAHT